MFFSGNVYRRVGGGDLMLVTASLFRLGLHCLFCCAEALRYNTGDTALRYSHTPGLWRPEMSLGLYIAFTTV